jgi:hypothetical protein
VWVWDVTSRAVEFGIYEGVRKTYDGPLTMSADLTLFNVTKGHIEVREVSPPGFERLLPTRVPGCC